MNTRDGHLTAKDGLSLYWKAWIPDGAPKAVLHILHGYAEHVERYRNVVHALVPAGYAVFGEDYRGHGKSKGKRGHVERFQDYIDDTRQFALDVIRPSFPGIPCFMLGHSMGSIVAVNYVVQYESHLKGLVLSGTGSLPGKGISKAIIALTKILSKQMQTYLLIGASNAQRISLPVLIQNGSEDASFSGQQELFDSIAAKDKTYKLYEGLRHEVYNELPADRIGLCVDGC